MITSANNGQIKNVIQLNQKAKARKEQGLFVAEGIKMFLEAPDDWIKKVFVSQTLWDEGSVTEKAQKYEHEVVADSVFRQMSDTKTPQGVLCVLKMPVYTPEQVLSGEHALIMVLEDLQDPGNAGTILRTGEGAGVTGVVLSKKTVDLFNPKVIRSTMGSVYRMPFCYVEDLREAVKIMKEKGIRTYAAHLRGQNSYDRESYQGKTAFFIGNEGNGLSEELSEQADCLIRIPMEGKVESLNAAMAAGILMYEAARQRR